jgi:hypothetical protein
MQTSMLKLANYQNLSPTMLTIPMAAIIGEQKGCNVTERNNSQGVKKEKNPHSFLIDLESKTSRNQENEGDVNLDDVSKHVTDPVSKFFEMLFLSSLKAGKMNCWTYASVMDRLSPYLSMPCNILKWIKANMLNEAPSTMD